MDLPIKNGGSFHSFLYVYQRVCFLKSHRLLLFDSPKSWTECWPRKGSFQRVCSLFVETQLKKQKPVNMYCESYRIIHSLAIFWWSISHFLFSIIIICDVILPIDEVIFFQRGRLKPPTRSQSCKVVANEVYIQCGKCCKHSNHCLFLSNPKLQPFRVSDADLTL